MIMRANKNIITDLQQEVVDILSQDPDLAQVGFLVENRWDIENEIQKNLKKTGLCGIVMTPTLEFAGTTSDRRIAWELPDLTIQIVEYVPINRASNNTKCQTCQDVAVKVADIMGPENPSWQNIQLVSIETGEDNGLLTSKVTLKCLITRPIRQVVWGTGTFKIEHIDETFAWDYDMQRYMCRRGYITQDDILISLAPGESYQSTNFDPTKTDQVVNFVQIDSGEPVDLRVIWTP